jgi:hypothetical protein
VVLKSNTVPWAEEGWSPFQQGQTACLLVHESHVVDHQSPGSEFRAISCNGFKPVRMGRKLPEALVEPTKSQVGTTGIAGGLPSPRRALLLAPLKGYLRLGLNPVLVPVSSYYVLP